MPTPTKAFFNNVNLINNAKWAYGMIKNVNPNVELIVTMDTQMTASVEYSDFGLPANSWVEFEGSGNHRELLQSLSCRSGKAALSRSTIPKTISTFSRASPTRWAKSQATNGFTITSNSSRRQTQHLHPALA